MITGPVKVIKNGLAFLRNQIAKSAFPKGRTELLCLIINYSGLPLNSIPVDNIALEMVLSTLFLITRRKLGSSYSYHRFQSAILGRGNDGVGYRKD
jgi:hypothetical protein